MIAAQVQNKSDRSSEVLLTLSTKGFPHHHTGTKNTTSMESNVFFVRGRSLVVSTPVCCKAFCSNLSRAAYRNARALYAELLYMFEEKQRGALYTSAPLVYKKLTKFTKQYISKNFVVWNKKL